jgi:hypothetical protein
MNKNMSPAHGIGCGLLMIPIIFCGGGYVLNHVMLLLRALFG